VVISPAQNFTGFSKAAAIARTISEGLGVIGVMAVELFETQSGELLINELAMRPHNSGHFSIEGSVTSQFEQHLRAVLDMPLGDTSQYASVCVMVNLLGVDDQNDLVSNYSAAMKQFPTWKFHSYQKQPRQGRKMGHVTALGDDAKALIREGLEVRNLLYQSSRKVNK
jgi:5-(carboxyamino)imidazole ribonucleotide synthase